MFKNSKLLIAFNQSSSKLMTNLVNTVQNRANRIYEIYEDYFGIKQLKDVQISVLSAEKVFTESSKARREAQASILKLQEELKRLRQKLDSTNRADEIYLNLLTEEHRLIKQEFSLAELLRQSEEDEREKFTFFSNRLRESQDYEKIRQEKLKYISLIGSVIGALLGILATSINHNVRQRDLSNLTKSLENQVQQDKEIDFYTKQLKNIVGQLETKLENSDLKSNDNVLKELKLLNKRLSLLDNHSSNNPIKSNDNHKLNILLAGLTLLTLTIVYDVFVKIN